MFVPAILIDYKKKKKKKKLSLSLLVLLGVFFCKYYKASFSFLTSLQSLHIVFIEVFYSHI